LTRWLRARIFKDYIARIGEGRERLRKSRSFASLGMTGWWVGMGAFGLDDRLARGRAFVVMARVQKRRLAAALKERLEGIA
jgi:hypothetical protein